MAAVSLINVTGLGRFSKLGTPILTRGVNKSKHFTSEIPTT